MSNQTIFDLKALRAELDAEDWQEGDNPDCETRRLFIGSVFALTPSGKYYMPWACSNVTSAEADEDRDWYAQAEYELDSIGCCLVSGEGDPCDLFVEESRDRDDDEGDA